MAAQTVISGVKLISTISTEYIAGICSEEVRGAARCTGRKDWWRWGKYVGHLGIPVLQGFLWLFGLFGCLRCSHWDSGSNNLDWPQPFREDTAVSSVPGRAYTSVPSWQHRAQLIAPAMGRGGLLP